jgi:hypothetical protein
MSLDDTGATWNPPPAGGPSVTDLADWRTVAEAASQIGCSKRTIERLAAAKKLESRLRPTPGSPAVAVYNPDDVQRLAAERRPAPAPFVLDGIPAASGNGNGHRSLSGVSIETGALATLPPADDPIRRFFEMLVRAIPSPPSPPVADTVAEKSENPFLTLAEAAAFRHVSERLVRKWMRTQQLDFEREPRSQWTAEDRGWRIRRKDLEAL